MFAGCSNTVGKYKNLDGKFKDVLFYKADVLKHAEKTYHPGE